jgi:hypothetical protein
MQIESFPRCGKYVFHYKKISGLTIYLYTAADVPLRGTLM